MMTLSHGRGDAPYMMEFLPDGRLVAAFPVSSGSYDIVDCQTGARIDTVSRFLVRMLPLAKAMCYEEWTWGRIELSVEVNQFRYNFRVISSGCHLLNNPNSNQRHASYESGVVNRFSPIGGAPGNAHLGHQPGQMLLSFAKTDFGYVLEVVDDNGVQTHHTGVFDWSDGPKEPVQMRRIYDGYPEVMQYRNLYFGRDPDVWLLKYSLRGRNGGQGCDLVTPNSYNGNTISPGFIYRREKHGFTPKDIATIGHQTLVLSPMKGGNGNSSGRRVYFLDNNSGAVNKIMELPHSAHMIASSPDGMLWAVAGKKIITVWDMD